MEFSSQKNKKCSDLTVLHKEFDEIFTLFQKTHQNFSKIINKQNFNNLIVGIDQKSKISSPSPTIKETLEANETLFIILDQELKKLETIFAESSTFENENVLYNNYFPFFLNEEFLSNGSCQTFINSKVINNDSDIESKRSFNNEEEQKEQNMNYFT